MVSNLINALRQSIVDGLTDRSLTSCSRWAANDIAMRVTMQYNSIKQGTVVNMDILAGVAVLDSDLAVVLQG